MTVKKVNDPLTPVKRQKTKLAAAYIQLSDIKKVRAKRSFYYFLKEFWHVIIPEKFVDNWHIKFLCDELQIVMQRVYDRQPSEYDLVINVPPGTSKTTIVTIMLPAWAWIKDQSIRALTVSYSASLSTDHSVKSRDIIKSDHFKNLFPDVAIRKDFDNKSHYKNEKNGERLATSLKGTITGFHAHVIIIDDPLNPKEASSEVERENAKNFFNATIPTRKIDKEVTPTILIMQRLHEDDPTGYMLEQKKSGLKVKHLCIPAETSQDVKPDTLKDFYIDGLMDAKRMSRKVLDDFKIRLGSYGYAGQMMQTPSPAGGGIWKQNFFKTFTDADLIGDDGNPKQILSIGSDWDLAYTEKETNSASALVTAGKIGSDMYVFDAGFKWVEFPALMEYMKTQKAPHYIEAKASGKSAKQTLTNQGIPAVEVTVEGGDKIARATMATPYAEAGLIYIHKRVYQKLLHDDKQGLLKFPNTGDDLNDAFVQAVNRLLGGHQTFFF